MDPYLEQRVAALEAQLARLRTNEALQPPGNTFIGPDGRTYGVFAGGVILPVDQSGSSPQGVSALEWTDDGTPIGALRGWLSTYLSGAFYRGVMRLPDPTVPGTGMSASIQLAVQPGVSGGVEVTAGQNTAIILDSSGESLFPQLPVQLSTQALWGAFLAGATAPSGTSSGGYTVAKLAAGQYQVSWTKAFADTGYAFTVTAAGGYADILAGSRITTSIKIELRSFADALTDLNWSFVALGAD